MSHRFCDYEQSVTAVGAKRWRSNARELAAEFGVTLASICDIASGKTWRRTDVA